MSNNAPDYTENLAFEPEMTWEDLVKWAKEFTENKKIKVKIKPDAIFFEDISFQSEGWVVCEYCYSLIVDNRTPRQMQTIIKALYE